MNGLRLAFCVLLFIVMPLTLASPGHAQATRTWVSGVGDDLNPCSRTAPCKTFAGAISKTATGGEIDCLDPGGFGAVTIGKSLTIDGTTGSGFGSILAASTTGVIVNGAATSRVTLRNLSIDGVNQSTVPGITGIRYLAGEALIVENCEIFGFNTRGIDASALAATSQLIVRDTKIYNLALEGIKLETSAGQA